MLRPAIHFLLVPVQAIIGPKIFATLLAVKHTATVMITCVLIRCGGYLQRFENLVTDITGVKHFFLVFCSVAFQQFLAAVKPQVVVLAEKGVLVTTAASIQHHHELPSAPRGPGDSGKTLLSMYLIRLKLV